MDKREEAPDILRKRLGQEIESFVFATAREYAREAAWAWLYKEPDALEAEIRLTLYDGTTRTIPLNYNARDDAMAIDVGDAGWLHLDAGGLYAFLWNEERASLEHEREVHALTRKQVCRLIPALARQFYGDDYHFGDLFREQLDEKYAAEPESVLAAYKELAVRVANGEAIDRPAAWYERAAARFAWERRDAGANPVSAGAGAGGGRSADGGGPKTAQPPGLAGGQPGQPGWF